MLMSKGFYLKNNVTLSDYDIGNRSILKLVPPESINIFIQTLYTTGEVLSLSVSPHDTIHDLKSKISKKEGIAQDKQILSFSSEFLRDEVQVCSYSIVNGSVLELSRPCDMELSIDTGKGLKKIKVEGTDTIRVVLRRIESEEKNYCRQYLKLHGRILKMDRTVSEYGLQIESLLQTGLRSNRDKILSLPGMNYLSRL